MLFRKNKDKTTLQENIDTLHTQLFSLTAGTSEYDDVLEQLERLYKLKNLNKGFHVDPNVLVAAGASLASVLLVLNYERIGNVLSSKATGFIPKM